MYKNCQLIVQQNGTKWRSHWSVSVLTCHSSRKGARSWGVCVSCASIFFMWKADCKAVTRCGLAWGNPIMNRLIKATGNSPNTSSHFLPLLNLSGIFASKIDYCVRKIEKVSLEILQDQCPPGHYFSLQYASHAWSVRKVTHRFKTRKLQLIAWTFTRVSPFALM